MIHLASMFPFECGLGLALSLGGLYLWKAPSRAEMWRLLEFWAGTNAQAAELRERLWKERSNVQVP
ncbi:MAG: hypothetical protein EBR82_22450 [Caulobacteraceae bacterium]|nr:hypothetical protein [Caulobacteraceae bacterium]